MKPVWSCQGVLMNKVEGKNGLLSWEEYFYALHAGTGGGGGGGGVGNKGLGAVAMCSRFGPLPLHGTEMEGKVASIEEAEAAKLPSVSVNVASIETATAGVGHNKARFDVLFKDGTVWSLMADSPSDCERWVSSFSSALQIGHVDSPSSIVQQQEDHPILPSTRVSQPLPLPQEESSTAGSGSIVGDEAESTASNLQGSRVIEKVLSGPEGKNSGMPWIISAIASTVLEGGCSYSSVVHGLPAFLKAVDRNGTGTVTPSEFKHALQRLGLDNGDALTEDMIAQSFAQLDDGSGEIAAQIQYEPFIRALVDALPDKDPASAISVMQSQSQQRPKIVMNGKFQVPSARAPATEAATRSSRAKAAPGVVKPSPRRRKAAASSKTSASPTRSKSSAFRSFKQVRSGASARNAVSSGRRPMARKRKKVRKKARDKNLIMVRDPASGQQSMHVRVPAPKVIRTNPTIKPDPAALEAAAEAQVRADERKAQLHTANREAALAKEEENRRAAEAKAVARARRRGTSARNLTKRSTSQAQRRSTRSRSQRSSASRSFSMGTRRSAAQQRSQEKSKSNFSSSFLSKAAADTAPPSLVDGLRQELALLRAEVAQLRERDNKHVKARGAVEQLLLDERQQHLREMHTLKQHEEQRDEKNTLNLDKLHALYNRQLEKLREMVANERRQCEDAKRERVEAELEAETLRQQLQEQTSGSDAFLNAKESAEKVASLEAEIQSLRASLAQSKEKEAGAKEKLLAEKKEASKRAKSMRQVDEDAAQARNLANELQHALALSKEEARLLECERQRLTLENSKLSRAIEKMDRMVYGNTSTRKIYSVSKGKGSHLSSSFSHSKKRTASSSATSYSSSAVSMSMSRSKATTTNTAKPKAKAKAKTKTKKKAKAYMKTRRMAPRPRASAKASTSSIVEDQSTSMAASVTRELSFRSSKDIMKERQLGLS
eukprot:g1450.t1